MSTEAEDFLGIGGGGRKRSARYDAPELDMFAEEVEKRYGLPTGIVRAIKNAGERSHGWQVSPKGARGIMQFMPATLEKYGVKDPQDPYELIDAAGRYLRDTSAQYGGNVDAMIADYSGGPRQAQRVLAGRRPAARETDAYLTRVNSYMTQQGWRGAAQPVAADRFLDDIEGFLGQGPAISTGAPAADSFLGDAEDFLGAPNPDFSDVQTTVEFGPGPALPPLPAPVRASGNGNIPARPEDREVGRIYTDKRGVPRRWMGDHWAAGNQARETTVGEFVGGAGVDIVQGLTRAPEALLDLLGWVSGGQSLLTPEGKADFEQARQVLEQLKPEAYRAEQAVPIVQRDAEGGVAGLNVPSAESLAGVLAQSAPQIPQMLYGGGALKSVAQGALPSAPRLASVLGYGSANAAMVAPGIAEQARIKALQAGATPEEAQSAANKAMAMAVPLTLATGGLGEGLAGAQGAGSRSLLSAILRGAATEAPTESIEEAGTSAIGDIAQGRDVNAANALEAGLMAALGGGLPGAAVGGTEYVSARGRPAALPEDPTTLQDILAPAPPAAPIAQAEPAATQQVQQDAEAFLEAPIDAPAAQPPVVEQQAEAPQAAEQAQPEVIAQPQVARAEAQAPVEQAQPVPPAQEEAMQNAAEGQPSAGESGPVVPPVTEPKVTGEMQETIEAPAESVPPVADPVQVDGRQGAKAFTATVDGKGGITLVDAEVAPGISEIIAYDGNERVGSLLYAADGTPPTVEVEPAFQRRGIATAMYALARQQGGVLGDAEAGIDGVGTKYRTDDGQAFRRGADESRVSLRPYSPPVGNTNVPTNGQLTSPVEMPVSQVEQTQAAPVSLPGAPMQDISDDRRNFPDERQAVASSSQSAAPRAAPELESAGESPVETSQRGRGASEDFTRASFTNRRSWSQKAFRDAGLDPDAAELLPIDKQFEAVAKVSAEKYGMKVQKSDKALGRMAVDSATDLYRNAETMAHVLGLPAKAIGLGDSLTVLFRDGVPYLGAMYPKGGKVEGVDLPPGAIALPRRSNSFAHEWGHALDLHLVSKYGLDGDNLVSRQIRDQGIDFQPNSSKEAFAKLMNAMFFDDAALAARVSALQQMADSGTANQQASAKRALQTIVRGNSKLKIEGTRYVIGSRDFGESVGGKSGRRYFGDPAEMMARAFEAYIAAKVESVGGDVSVLAKGDRAYLSTDDQRFAQTYPKLDERIKIFAAFDDLFYQLGKEQLITSGVPAANPGNLDAFDPRLWLGDVERPAEYKGIKGALREQADQWSAAREQARRERARPADPMTRWQRLQNAVMPALSPIQSAFRVMERRYPKSKAIRELANSLVTDPGADRAVGRVLEQAIRITGGRNYNQFGNIIARYGLDKLDDASRTQLRRLLVSAEDPAKAKPELVQAASELRRFMDTLWYDNQEAGINIGYTKNGYLPRVVDMASVIADPEGFIKAATDAYKAKFALDDTIDPAEVDERAEAAARAWHFNLVNAPSMNFGNKTPAENYTKHRSLTEDADVLLEKFYVSDPLEVIHRYIGMSAKNVEFAKLFGEKGEKLNLMFEQMGTEGVSKEDQLYMQGMVENLLGRAPSMLDKKPRMAAMMNQVNAYGVMSMLGRVLISSIAEPGMAGIRTGNAANVYRPYWNLFKQVIGTADMKQWREITKAIGLIGDAQADMVIQSRLGGTFESTPKTDARLARYFGITGLHALTNAQRVSLMPVAHRYLSSLSEQLSGKPAQAKEARALLAELGIKDAETFARWMDDGRPPSIDDLFDANGRETEQGAAYMTAMSRINEQIVQAPYRFDRPEMANTPVGRFLYGIMSFNLAFWNNVYKRQAKVIARAAKERGVLGVAGYVGGQLAPPVLAYFFTQMLVTAAREALLNPQRWEEWDRDDKLNENLVLLTLSRSFPAGLFDIPIQAYQGLKYQRDLTGVAVGAVPSYFLGNMQKIIQVFQDSNSEKTNNAEFAGMQGAYQVVANPLIAHLLTSAPGGRILDPIYGLALAYGTSAAARDQVATAVVGERDSLVAKRKRDERRAGEVESGSRSGARGDVRNDDRRENAR